MFRVAVVCLVGWSVQLVSRSKRIEVVNLNLVTCFNHPRPLKGSTLGRTLDIKSFLLVLGRLVLGMLVRTCSLTPVITLFASGQKLKLVWRVFLRNSTCQRQENKGYRIENPNQHRFVKLDQSSREKLRGVEIVFLKFCNW